VIHFDPSDRTYPVISAFAQDEFSWRPSGVFVTAGLKVEHNAFSGTDWQPNLRARWLLPRQHVLWGAVARAVRRPTRFDDDIVVTAPTGIVLVEGSDAFESEGMTGWEVGYRAPLTLRLSVDATTFVQRYGNLRSQEAPESGIIPVTLANTLDGRSSGMEIAVNVLPVDRWRLRASYSYLDTEIRQTPGSRDVSGGLNEANDPHHLFSLRTGIDVGEAVEVDAWIRHVSSLPNPPVPAYTELNARVGWRPRPGIEMALIGQDLLQAQHPEFGSPLPQRIEFQRSVRALISLRVP
jgi:iron complex outermembrane receptor protein